LEFRNTSAVVKMEKRAPNPTTTRYPTAGESGVAPPKYVSFPVVRDVHEIEEKDRGKKEEREIGPRVCRPSVASHCIGCEVRTSVAAGRRRQRRRGSADKRHLRIEAAVAATLPQRLPCDTRTKDRTSELVKEGRGDELGRHGWLHSTRTIRQQKIFGPAFEFVVCCWAGASLILGWQKVLSRRRESK
jgi:hypothetical protein